MMEFLAMGGYGAYVWTAYGLAALAFAGLWLEARKRRASGLRAVQAARRRERP